MKQYPTLSRLFLMLVLSVAIQSLSAKSTGKAAGNFFEPPINGLIHLYKMDGNALDSFGTNNGSFVNGPIAAIQNRENAANSALDFKADRSQYISTANSYNAPAAFSISVWFKTTYWNGGVLAGFSSLKTGNGGMRDRILYLTNDAKLHFMVLENGVQKTITGASTALNDGRWHHVIATYGTGGMKLYLDGKLIGQNESVLSADVYSGYWRLGNSDISTLSPKPTSAYFSGSMDDVAIYNRELQPEDIFEMSSAFKVTATSTMTCPPASTGTVTVSASGGTAPYTYSLDGISFQSSNVFRNLSAGLKNIIVRDNAGRLGYTSELVKNSIVTIPQQNLTAYYPLNGNATDLMGNMNGTLLGNPSFEPDRFGVTSSAIHLNGSQQITTTKSFNNPNNITLSLWFKTASTSGGVLIGLGRALTATYGYNFDRVIYMSNSGQLFFGVYPGQVVTVQTSERYNDNKWHHVVASLSSADGMKLYVDGVQKDERSDIKNGESFEGTWVIGNGRMKGYTSNPTKFYFSGSLDEVALYNRAITNEEVSQLFSTSTGAGNNGPVCAGSHLQFTAPTITGATYSWTGPNGFTATTQNPSRSFSAGMAGNYTVAVNIDGCIFKASTTVAAASTPGQWTGVVSSDWNVANNWCDGVVPDSTTNVTIAAGVVNMPVISGVANANDIDVLNGGTVTTSATGNLNVSGKINNEGSMINLGTTTFKGKSPQTFTGVAKFYNVKLDKTTILTLPESIELNNLYLDSGSVLKAGSFDVDVKGNWTNYSRSAAGFDAGSGKVTFTGNQHQNITGVTPTVFNTVYASNVSGGLTLANDMTVKNILVVGGVFDLQNFNANGSIGHTLYMSEKGVLKIGGTKTYPTGYATYTFLPASTVEYYGANQTVAGYNYGNLILSGTTGVVVKNSASTPWSTQRNFTIKKGSATSVSFTASANHSINGDVVIETGASFNGASFTTNVGGNWTNGGTFTGGSGTVILKGATTHVSGSGANNFNNLTIEGAGVTFSNQNLNLSGNLATVGSGSFVQQETGTITMTGANASISGNGITIGNLIVSGKVMANNSLSILGNLRTTGTTSSFLAPNVVITMKGISKTIGGPGNYQFKNLNIKGNVNASSNFSISELLNVEGEFSATSGKATFTGTSSLTGTANLFDVTINGVKLILSGNSVLGIANQFDITAGSLDVLTSVPNTVYFNGAATQNIPGINYYNLQLKGGSKNAAAAITVNGNITIESATTLHAGAFNHIIYGNWNNAGNFNGDTGSVTFKGSNNSTITGVTTFNNLAVDHGSNTVSLVLNDDVNASIVNVGTGNVQTGTKTITITKDRTGAGIIMGNIKRMHAFNTGIDYAFEGPDNIINFNSITGSISAITVSVEKKEISDFHDDGAIDREYKVILDASSNLSYAAKLRLHYEDNELNGVDESKLSMWKTAATGNWSSVGGTQTKDVNKNFVEVGNLGVGILNLLPLDGRWTLASSTSKFVWKGRNSSDWSTPSNWNDNGSTASRIPDVTDVVQIGVESFNHQPVISDSVNAQSVIFGSEKAVVLGFVEGRAGVSLTTSTIKGTWNKAAAHSINLGDMQSLTVKGDLILSDGNAGNKIDLQMGSSYVTVLGSIIQTGDASVTSQYSLLYIGGDFINNGASFVPGYGSVWYTGTGNQIVAAVPYHNLVISKTGGQAIIDKSITATGLLQVSGELVVNAETTVKGNVTIMPAGKITNKNILHVGGNWKNDGVFDGIGIKVVFDGTGTQTISKTTFNHLEINKPVGTRAELTGDVTLKGFLWGISGALDIKNFKFNRDVMGGFAYLANDATLILGGTTAPRNFSNYNFEPNSTVIFNGDIAQDLLLSGLTYGNLIFKNAGVKTIKGSLTLQGNLIIEPNATVVVQEVDIKLNGNWQNQGSFIPGSSTVFWNGINKEISGVTTFNKVVVAGSYSVKNALTFNDFLEIKETGVINSGAAVTYTMHGDFNNSGSLTILGEGIFTGNKKQTLRLINAVKTEVRTITFNGSVSPELISTSQPVFGILNVNNTGGISTSVGWSVLAQLNIGTGATFNGRNFTHNIHGDMVNHGKITSGGKFNFVPETGVNLDFGNDFESTGTVVFGNTGAISIAGTPKTLTNVIVENTNATGVEPASGWTILGDLIIKPGGLFKAAAHTHKIKGHLHDSGTLKSATSTIVFNGVAVQDLQTLSDFNNVTIENAGGYLRLLSDLKVRGELNFVTGKIVTGNEKVVVLAGGNVTGASASTGWVHGFLSREFATGTSEKVFEVGDEQVYTPVSLNFNNVSTSGFAIVNSIGDEHPNIANSVINADRSVNRYYSVRNEGITFTTYSARFHFVNGDIDAGANAAAFGVARFNGSSWSTPEVGEANPLTTLAISLKEFGEFAVGEICNNGTAIAYASSVYCTDEGIANVLQTGTSGGIFSAAEGLAVDPATGAIQLMSSIPGNYTINYFVEEKGSCAAFFTKTQVKVGIKGLWNGIANTDWNNEDNWSCKIPAAADDVTIGAGSPYHPVITDENGVHHLTVKADGLLTVEGVLTVSGLIHNAGVLDLSSGTLQMTGAMAQTIPALKDSALKNLSINNTSTEGVTIESALNLFGGMEFIGRGQVLHTNHQLTLKSNEQGTAWIGDLTGNSITGDVTVERYLTPFKAWRVLSIPTLTTQDVKSSWMEGGKYNDDDPKPGYGLQITSERSSWQSEGFDLYSRGGASMKSYNPQTNKWVGITSTYNKIETDRGYMVFMRGNRKSNAFNSPVTSTVLRTKGPLKAGDQPVITTAPGTYTLVGNPYASPIDFSKIQMGNGIDNVFYVWDPQVAGNYNLGGYQTLSATNGYKPVPGGTAAYPTGVEAKTLESGLAFFVHSSTDDGSGKNYDLQMKESAKESATGGGGTTARVALSRGGAEKRAFLGVTLFTGPQQNARVADGNVVAFDAAFSNDLDRDDAVKMLAEGENFGLKRNGKVLAIEARTELNQNDTIYYYMSRLKTSTYQLRFAPVNLEYSGMQAYLIDNYLQTSTPVSLHDSTFVEVTVTSAAGSAASDRFELVFKPMAPLPVTVTSVSAVVSDDAVSVTWKTQNEVNMKSYELERSLDGNKFAQVYTVAALNRPSAQYQYTDAVKANGYVYYRVRITDEEGKITFTEVVKVRMENGKSGFAVYPNPVENGQIHLYIDAPAAKFEVRLLNELGQAVMQRVLEHGGGSSKATISVDSKVAHGVYHLEVIGGGKREMIKLKY